MIKKLNKYLDGNEKLLKHSLIIFIAGLLAGFFNYIFQIYMGRALGPEQYGILGALFSIFYIESFAYTGIDTIITKFISEYKARKQFGKINSLKEMNYQIFGKNRSLKIHIKWYMDMQINGKLIWITSK